MTTTPDTGAPLDLDVIKAHGTCPPDCSSINCQDIFALTAEVERLRAALRPLAEHDGVTIERETYCGLCFEEKVDSVLKHDDTCPVLAARRALGMEVSDA